MRIMEVRDEAEFERLRPIWNNLLETSASNTIFLTWEWLAAWWPSYGTPGDLRIWLAHDEAECFAESLHCGKRQYSRHGQTVSTLSFAGDGSNDTDYTDFILASGYEAQVMAAFNARLQVETRTWDSAAVN